MILGNFTDKTVACACIIPEGEAVAVLSSAATYQLDEAMNVQLGAYGYLVLKVQ